MPVMRHDWLKYKKDYFNSEVYEIKDFFKKLGLPQSDIERRGYPEIVMEAQGVKFIGQQ